MTMIPPRHMPSSPRAMTGDDVQRLREQVSLSPTHFALLFGVHVATAYRWELARARALELDPLHAALMSRLEDTIETLHHPADRVEWGRSLAAAIDQGGTLEALAFLFREHRKAPTRRRTRGGAPRASTAS
jgi:hypothetical protein